METAQNVTEEYNLWKGRADFIDEWFMMYTPYPILAIITVYLLFVLKIGPDFMKKRPPMDLSSVILLYNVIQVFFSIYLASIGTRLLWRHGILSPGCLDDKKEILTIASGTYLYVIAKVTELLDTVFFVLRKKYNQVSFLHVYHHSVIALSAWFMLKFEPTFSCVFLGTLNSYVHMVMYAYYALSTFPALAPYLWWKKYITKLQLTQFVLVIIQMTAEYFMGCPPSTVLVGFIIFNLMLMIYLFSDFYSKAYASNETEKTNELNKRAATSVKYKQKISNGKNDKNNDIDNKVNEKVH